jgi:hypothetical protein
VACWGPGKGRILSSVGAASTWMGDSPGTPCAALEVSLHCSSQVHCTERGNKGTVMRNDVWLMHVARILAREKERKRGGRDSCCEEKQLPDVR